MDLSRKKFIVLLASSAAGIFLASCASRLGIAKASAFSSASTAAATSAAGKSSADTSSEDKESGSTDPALTKSSETNKSFETTGNQANTQGPKKSIVGIAGQGYGSDLGAQIESAVNLAGGLGFIKKGSVVLLKPNFNTGDANPASTNPEVIRHVIRLVKKQNPYVIVIGDRSGFWSDTIKCMSKNGVDRVAEQEGAELYPFDDGQWVLEKPSSAKTWPKGFKVPKLLKEADYVISIPVIKTHSIATFTMAIKNWVGILDPLQRTTDLHLFNSNKQTFGHMLAELHLSRLPDFTVMDGTKAFVDGGPTEGTAVEPGLVVASNDIIANDAAGLAILKTFGTIPKIQDYSVWSQPQIDRAVQLGFGAKKASDIEIIHENAANIDKIISNLA